jgi:predicted transcriptional regulator
MEAILSAVAKDGLLLTGLTTEEVVRSATISQIGAVVFVRGKEPSPRVIAQAESFKLPLLVTDYSMFVSIGKLYMNGLRGLDGSW